jgi:chitodextrinase
MLLGAREATAAIAYVQSNSASPSTTVSSVGVPFTAAQSAGDFIVIGVSWGSSASISSVADTKGNVYTLAVGPTTFSGAASAIYYAKNIVAATAGANTVTVTFNTATGTPDLRVAEYSGIDTTNPLDVTVVSTGTSATSSSGSATTTNANDLLIGSNAVLSGTSGAGTGFTKRQISTFDGNILEDEIVSSTGAYTASAPLISSAAWIMQLAAFKAASSGGDATPPSQVVGLGATVVSSSQINLSWTAATDNVGVTGYEVWRCQGAGCSTFTRVGTPSGTTFNDTGLSASTSYTYKVRAADAAGNLGSYSSTVTASTSANPITFVQSKNNSPNNSSLTTLSVAFPSAQTAGDLNVVAIGWGSSTVAVSSVTDSKGNAYTLAVGPTSMSGVSATTSIYYAKNIVAAAAGANTVTVTFNSAVPFPDLRVAEYSGINTTSPLDVTAAATGTSTLCDSGSATTTNANDLLVGSNWIVSATSSAGTGFIQREGQTGWDGDILEDRIVSAAGAYDATAANSTSSQWIMQMAAFKAAGSSSDTSPPSPLVGLSATAVSSSQINLSWSASTDNVGVTGYEVWRCQGASCSTFSLITTVTGTTYSDTGLSASTSYSYKVRAKDAAGNLGTFSSVVTQPTNAGSGDTQAPSAPASLVIVATSSSEVDLSWQASTDNVGVSNYVVERCSGSGCSNFSPFGPVTAPPYYDTSVAAAGNYSYRVRALDAAGNASLYSNVVSTPTPAASPDCN